MPEVLVKLKKEIDYSYPIVIRPGLVAEAPGWLAERYAGSTFAVISDSNVAPLYASDLLEGLRQRGCRAMDIVSFPAGETSKNRRVKENLEDELFQSGLGRDSVIVALGGGVVGDLAGFTAATFARGVSLVQIPTTLLAMVDSSIGGKTGVDVPWGKNLVGAFHQPELVLIDPGVLTTLENRQFTSGLAEVVKHGVIRDPALFAFLENNLAGIAAIDLEIITELIARSCRIKAEVVRIDERESDLRQILNFGHTVGHAVETLSGFDWLHGQAVSCGMVVEADIAVKLGLFAGAESERLEELLLRLELPVDLSGLERGAAGKIIELTCLDKKARGGRPRYVLPSAIGEMAKLDNGTYGLEVEDEIVLEILTKRGATATG